MGIELLDYVRQAEEAGAGEIFLNSIDRDGTYRGIDLEIAEDVSAVSSIPVIVCGGTNSIQDIERVFNTDISAVAVGSLFVFYGKLKAVLINYPDKKKFGFLE
jgi:cyclase